MSKRNCSRNGCFNVMCSEMINGVGFICKNCKSELELTNPSSLEDVLIFIQSEKDEFLSPDSFKFSLDDLIFTVPDRYIKEG